MIEPQRCQVEDDRDETSMSQAKRAFVVVTEEANAVSKAAYADPMRMGSPGGKSDLQGISAELLISTCARIP